MKNSKETIEQEIERHEALLKQKPNDAYVLRWLAFKYAQQAKSYKEVDREQYRVLLEKSLSYSTLAMTNGYEGLEKEHQLIQKLLNTLETEPVKEKRTVPLIVKGLISIGFMLVGSVIAFPLEVNDAKPMKESGDLVQQVEENAVPVLTVSDAGGRHFTTTVRLETGIPSTDVYRRAMEKIEEMRKHQIDASIEVVLVQERNGELVELGSVSMKEGSRKPMKAEHMESLNPVPLDGDALSLTVLRSAVYHYVLQHHVFPTTLEELTKAFPTNYLSVIPKDRVFFQNHIQSMYDGTGGWVYQPNHEFDLKQLTLPELRVLIAETVTPNFHHPCTEICAFQPLELHVDKVKHTLQVLIGGRSFGEIGIGVGKEDSTPEGLFYISKRVVFPNYQLPKEKRYYGTRGMELSGLSYAIHGTTIEKSIGNNLSSGCVRVLNEDIERLFEVTPLFTTVMIKSGEDQASIGNPGEDAKGVSMPSEKDDESTTSKDESKPGLPLDTINPSVSSFGSGYGNGKGGGMGAGQEMDNNTIYEWLK